MEGIRKERLIDIMITRFVDENTMKLIISECAELNPWLSIEQAPKDRLLLGFVNGKKRLIKWGKTSHVPLYGFCLADQGAEDFDICDPTHYQELPPDPKE